MNQIELHPHHAQSKLIKFCHEQDIAVTAYSPLWSTKWLESYGEVELDQIAKKHQKTVAQVLIRWAIERGTIPIPRTENMMRIAENIDVYDFELDDDDISKITAIQQTWSVVDYYDWWGVPYF